MAGRLATERRSKILEAIRMNGSVSVNDLARDLDVSVMTIRRDLALLDREGLIERCHGGAVVQSEVSYSAKRETNRESKEKIAEILMESNVKIFMLGGQIQNETGSAWGYFATQMLENFNLDLGFFGASCIDEQLMISTPTTDKAFLKREAVRRCAKSVLAVDAGKFGNKAVIAVNRVEDYDILVTDRILTDLRQAARKSCRCNISAFVSEVPEMQTQ